MLTGLAVRYGSARKSRWNSRLKIEISGILLTHVREGVPNFMQGCRKGRGRTVLGAVLTAIALLAIPAAARSQQAGAATGRPSSEPLQESPKMDTAPTRDENSDDARNTFGNAEQQPPAQQQGGKQSSAPPPATTDSQKSRLAVNPITGLTVSPATNFIPLTGDERWKLYWKQNFFSMGAYFRPIFFALVLDQTTNSPSQWGGGFGGFGPRVGSRILSNITQGTIRAPLAAVLHEDVRYITDHRGGKRRLWHAVEYSFLTYNNQGQPTLNIAKLVGYYASTAISTAWRPGHHSLPEYTFGNGSEQLGLSVPINILQEFWPEVSHKIVRLWHKVEG